MTDAGRLPADSAPLSAEIMRHLFSRPAGGGRRG